MANGIDMVPEALPMSRSEENPIQQQSGGSGIDMWGGDGVSLSHTPIASEQKGKGESGMDWVGHQGLLSHNIVTPYGSKFPSDKGEV